MEARLVGYQTHVQDFGTQAYVYDGAVAGTSGQAKRMESIRINLPSTMASEARLNTDLMSEYWMGEKTGSRQISYPVQQERALD